MRAVIVGMRFRDDYNPQEMAEAAEYKLTPEPENPYNDNAIAAYYKTADAAWKHFGYISRDYIQSASMRAAANESRGFNIINIYSSHIVVEV